MKYSIFIFLSLWILDTWSAETDSCNAKGESWQIQKTQNQEGEDKIIFSSLKSRKEIATWTAEIDLYKVRECYIVKIDGVEFAILISGHGAKSESLRILNPLRKTNVQVYEQTSVSTINYIATENEVKILYQDETSEENSDPVNKTDIWKPSL